jgi:hypothetical protein
MTKFYRIGSKWMIALLVIVMLVAVGCSDDDDPPAAPTNSAPTVTSVTVTPASLGSSGGTAVVSVAASDPDGDNLTYSYSATYGSVTGSTNTATWIVPANGSTNPVTGVVNVTVSDGQLSAMSVGNCTVAGVAAATTKITGTLTLEAGVQGNLDNTQVAIYGTLADWAAYAPALYDAAVGIGLGASATYSLDPVASGTWYLDAWKDNDANFFWSQGDLVGWAGTGGLGAPILSAFSLAQGQHHVINISNMIPIP